MPTFRTLKIKDILEKVPKQKLIKRYGSARKVNDKKRDDKSI